MLEAELDDHLGYDRYDNKNKSTTNSRNGYRNKK
ncbi:MAG: transposase [Terrisporobacter sp.]